MVGDPVRDFADKIAATYHGTAKRFGREWRVFCPVHESGGRAAGHSPSLAVWRRASGSVAFACMVGCKHRDIVDRLVTAGVQARPAHMSREEYQRSRALEEAKIEESRAKAAALFNASRDVERGDPTDLYLRSRGIELRPEEARFLRTVDDPDNPGCSMMMGLVVDPITLVDPNVRSIAVATLALTQDAKARVNYRGYKHRSVLGPLRTAGVFFGNNSPELVLGEGIESVLSAMRLLDKPFGCAALTSSNVPNLAIPPFVQTIYVVTDNDVAGSAAAHRCILNWRPLHFNVIVRMWGAMGTKWDANDEWMKRTRTE